jgi:two-component system, LytTR family, sensor kinase
MTVTATRALSALTPPRQLAAVVSATRAARAAARPGFARGWRRYVLAFAGWTAAGVVLAQQSYAAQQVTGHPRPLLTLLAPMFADMWLWALFTPAIMDLGRDFPVDRREHLATRVPLHLAAAFAFAALDAVIMWSVKPYLCDCPPISLAAEFSGSLFAVEASYLILVAMGVAALYLEQSRDRELAAVALSAELADAKLAALNAQLRPHFLFNTLNAIAELVHVDPQAADRTVTALGGLLRRALAAGDRQEVPLREELSCVDEYLAIVATRLDERLRVSTSIDAEALDARVPSFLLQPLVENAVRHGIERTPDGGHVEIAAWRDGDWLHVEVRDDGAGLRASTASALTASAPSAGGGHGLRTTRERLRHLYGDAQSFALRGPPSGGRGAVAAVRLPFTPATVS